MSDLSLSGLISDSALKKRNQSSLNPVVEETRSQIGSAVSDNVFPQLAPPPPPLPPIQSSKHDKRNKHDDSDGSDEYESSSDGGDSVLPRDSASQVASRMQQRARSDAGVFNRALKEKSGGRTRVGRDRGRDRHGKSDKRGRGRDDSDSESDSGGSDSYSDSGSGSEYESNVSSNVTGTSFASAATSAPREKPMTEEQVLVKKRELVLAVESMGMSSADMHDYKNIPLDELQFLHDRARVRHDGNAMETVIGNGIIIAASGIEYTLDGRFALTGYSDHVASSGELKPTSAALRQKYFRNGYAPELMLASLLGGSAIETHRKNKKKEEIDKAVAEELAKQKEHNERSKRGDRVVTTNGIKDIDELSTVSSRK